MGRASRLNHGSRRAALTFGACKQKPPIGSVTPLLTSRSSDYPAYFREIDAHLLTHTVEGAELVFFLPNSLFGRSFEMRSATVVTE